MRLTHSFCALPRPRGRLHRSALYARALRQSLVSARLWDQLPSPPSCFARCGEGRHTEARRQRALASGWFFDTNLSSPQVRLRPRTRVRGCGHHVRRGPGPARAIARRCSHIGRPCLENASKPVAQQRDFWLVPVGDQRARVARVVAAVAARFVLVRRDVGVGHFQAAAGDAGLHKRRVEILL